MLLVRWYRITDFSSASNYEFWWMFIPLTLIICQTCTLDATYKSFNQNTANRDESPSRSNAASCDTAKSAATNTYLDYPFSQLQMFSPSGDSALNRRNHKTVYLAHEWNELEGMEVGRRRSTRQTGGSHVHLQKRQIERRSWLHETLPNDILTDTTFC